MLQLIKQACSSLIAGLLILQMFSPMFVSGVQVMNQMRDLDSELGLLERPARTYSALAEKIRQNLGGVEADAQILVFDATASVNFLLEKALNALIRSAILAFVKAILNFILQKFRDLLNQIQDWANTTFGLRLNLCYVFRQMAIKTYTFYNKAVDNVTDWTERTFGGINTSKIAREKEILDTINIDNYYKQAGIMASFMADATASYELNRAIQQADNDYPDCASDSYNYTQSNNAESQKNELYKSVQDFSQSLCYKDQVVKVAELIQTNQELRAAGQKSIADFIPAVASLDPSFNVFACATYSTIQLADFQTGLNNREQGANGNGGITQAVKDSNAEVKRQTPADCKGAILLEQKIDNEIARRLGQFESMADLIAEEQNRYRAGVESGNVAQVALSSAVLSKMGNLGDAYSARPLNNSECKASDTVQAAYQAIQSSQQNNASGDETIGDALLNTLTSFLESVFNVLKELVTQVFNSIVNKFLDLVNNFANGVFTDSFKEFFITVKGEMDTGLSNLRRDLNNQVTALRNS